MVWSVAGPREGPGGRPLILRPNRGPKRRLFLRTDPPPPHLFKGLDDRPPYPTPYLKVSGSSTAGSFEG